MNHIISFLKEKGGYEHEVYRCERKYTNDDQPNSNLVKVAEDIKKNLNLLELKFHPNLN